MILAKDFCLVRVPRSFDDPSGDGKSFDEANDFADIESDRFNVGILRGKGGTASIVTFLDEDEAAAAVAGAAAGGAAGGVGGVDNDANGMIVAVFGAGVADVFVDREDVEDAFASIPNDDLLVGIFDTNFELFDSTDGFDLLDKESVLFGKRVRVDEVAAVDVVFVAGLGDCAAFMALEDAETGGGAGERLDVALEILLDEDDRTVLRPRAVDPNVDGEETEETFLGEVDGLTEDLLGVLTILRELDAVGSENPELKID